jgi:hypothetical protein
MIFWQRGVLLAASGWIVLGLQVAHALSQSTSADQSSRNAPDAQDTAESAEPADKKPVEVKPVEAKPVEVKPVEVKTRVRGFGVDYSRRPVPGFGLDPPTSFESADRSETTDGKRSPPSLASRTDARLNRLANSLLVQFDRNGNGQLEAEEWRRMSGNPQASDRNGDQILDRDELVQHLAGYGRRRGTTVKEAAASSRRRRENARGDRRRQGKSYRFASPHERLPKGLPDWFVKQDSDFDGQLTMPEFAPRLSLGKVSQFERLDLNRDGLLVPEEYLQATDDSSQK